VLYAIPSLIAIFLFLLRVDLSFVYNFFLSLLSTEEQISALNSLRSDVRQYGPYAQRRKELKQKLTIENKRKEEYEENRQRQEFRKKYVNDDMVRIEQLLAGIPPKIDELNNFNNQLQNTVNEYEEKAIQAIENAYRDVLDKLRLMPRRSYFKNFDKISRKYVLEDQYLAMDCDKAVKSISSFINAKQAIINKNNDDIAKYNHLMQKLQKKYDDELAHNKIKEINKDVQSQMGDTSDNYNKEINNAEIESIVSDIELLDKEINERRSLDFTYGE
jgi:ribosomal protein L18E